jgi:hypothetical protein
LIIPYSNIIRFPVLKNRLKNVVKSSSTITAFRPLKMYRTGTFDSLIAVNRNIVTAIYPYKESNKNSDNINKKVPINFTLGSSRCMMEPDG